jgi:hypothetical protein
VIQRGDHSLVRDGSRYPAVQRDDACCAARVRKWHKADITLVLNQCPLSGVKRTLVGRAAMSAYDPNRRLERIDKLAAQVDQLRQRNQKLDAECEHLAELFRENATPAPK